MWRVDNHTQYTVGCTWIRDQDGAEVWVVAVKATYDILPDGELQVANVQVPVFAGPVPYENSDSVQHETDLGPEKAATDVLLIGNAWALNGKPVTDMLVGLKVGAMTRVAHVYGDREWKSLLLVDTPGAAKPFTKMPLTWERAYGGDGPECRSGNPVGCGIHPDAHGIRTMPNIEHSKKRLSSPRSNLPATGFGPIARNWPLRRQYGGTYDANWQATRAPLLPLDFDHRFWQIAPVEQQVPGRLKGGEPIALAGLAPSGFGNDGVLHATLPKVTLAFETQFTDGTSVNSRSAIHSVIFDTSDTPRVSVVHHMALPCHAKVNQLARTIIFEKSRPLDRVYKKAEAPIDWESLEIA